MMKSSPRYLSGAALCVCLWHNPAPAQLSHNLSIGNPVALSMANSATAYIRGPDAIHYNPAALALVERLSQLLEVDVPCTDLEIAAAAYERQVTELVAEDDGTMEYVGQLEADFDEETAEDPDSLVAEVEDFLRNQPGT